MINRGFGGYNTDWLLPVLENQIIPSVYNVVLWIILIGANDAMLSPGPNHVHSHSSITDSGTNRPISKESIEDDNRHL